MKSHDNFKNGNQDCHRIVVHTCMYLQQGYQSHYSPRLWKNTASSRINESEGDWSFGYAMIF